MTLLLYADDLCILAKSRDELQQALDAVADWGRLWRFSFGIGPTKSAVLCVNPEAACPPPLLLGGHPLPLVPQYR